MKYLAVNSIFLLSSILSFSQSMQPAMYKDVVFNKVIIQKEILYDSNNNIKTKYRQFDFYEPENDSSIKRPLIIWMHGGGFKYGSKNAKEITIWGNEFAQRGYAFAAINYRLSKKNTLFKFKDLVEACYENVDDVKKAILFFKLNATKFNIDTNKIILGGNSAGGVIALQSVYSNSADMQNVIDSNKIIAGTGKYNTENIAAIINFWGAIFNDAWLSRAKVPIVSVHGAKDKTVPIDHKGVAFFGSLAIHKKSDSLHIPNDIKIYESYGHELQKHFNPFFRSNATKKRWKEAAQFAANFLYDNLLKQHN